MHIIKRNIVHLKIGIWIYFFLLIFEGALRKWIIPELSNPLLLIRDPLAMWILFTALHKNVWRPNLYVILMVGITFLSFCLALLIGHGSLTVGLYGLRITVLHFPLIFIIGQVFNEKDVEKMGKIVLWLTIAMTILVVLQFFSPQTAWVNRGVGGNIEGSGFWGAEGYYRVPGTFSFTTGLSHFYGLAAGLIFYFWISKKKKKVSKTLLFMSTVALVAAVPLSISRTLLFEVTLSLVFLLILIKRNASMIRPVMTAVLAGACLFVVLSNFSFFQTAISAFEHRFTTANSIEGGMVEGVILDRFLGGMYGALIDKDLAFWGVGLGMGSSVGAKLLVGDRTIYLVAEQEWGRIMGEMGVILGIFMILVRAGLVVELLKRAWVEIGRRNYLPWMLMSYGMLVILQGQWAQTTNLGFAVIAGGLTLASLHYKDDLI